MSGDIRTGKGLRPWMLTIFEASGLPLWLVGIALAGFGIIAFGVQELVLGRFQLAGRDSGVLANARVAVTHVVITAYLLTAHAYAQRTTEQAISAVLPLIDPVRRSELLARSRGARAAIGLSVVLGVALFVFVTTRLSPGEPSLSPGTWDPEETWHRVFGLSMAILAVWLSARIILESNRLSGLARAIRHIDLLSTDAIGPFARQALTYALLVIGAVAAFALFLVDLRYLPLVGIVLAMTLGVGSVALFLPLRGIRARIVEAKCEELLWCHEQMRARRAQLVDAASAEGASLADLVAWEARIREVRELPLDASALKRFGLYLLLPLGSWAGAALVERGIDALLE